VFKYTADIIFSIKTLLFALYSRSWYLLSP